MNPGNISSHQFYFFFDITSYFFKLKMSWLWGSNSATGSANELSIVTENAKMPTSFPYAPKECKDKSTVFFNCINSKSEKENDLDIDAGERGMKGCLVEMKSYEACMKDFEKKIPPRRMRVSSI